MIPWQNFRHITKLDPDKNNSPEIIKAVVESKTDSIMISGTQGITKANVSDLYGILKDSTDKPILVEPVHKSSLLYDVDYIYIPVVLNTDKIEWLQGMHIDWLGDLVKYNKDLPWDKVVTEGYIILNPESTVSKVTNAITNLDNNQIATYACYGQLLGLDSIYLEYSGRYGDPSILSHTKKVLKKPQLFYGGGIGTKQQSKEMLEFADTIFVGNIVYNDIQAYIDTIPV